jgi:hypothetical protein
MNAFFLSLALGSSQVIARGINISAVSTAFPSFSKLLKQLVPRLCSNTGLKPGANESKLHTVLFWDL